MTTSHGSRTFAHTLCRVGSQVALLSMAVVILCPTRSVTANMFDDLTIGGLPSSVPVVPTRKPRDTGDSWEPDQDKGDTSSFIETLKGNDAAIEVILGQGRLLTLKSQLGSKQDDSALIAVGDPTVLDFDVLPNGRTLRLIGKRAGVTDLSITTADDKTYSFEVHVGYDLELLSAQLRQVFPSALIRVAQLREHIIVEGQARSSTQVTRILQMIEAYLASMNVERNVRGQQVASNESAAPSGPRDRRRASEGGGGPTVSETGRRPTVSATPGRPQIINLLRVPGVQQVMLKVQIAELNRTGMREIGADLLYSHPSTGTIGTNIAGLAFTGSGLGGLLNTTTGGSTGFGIFPSDNFQILLKALRQNQLATILAEPNLIALNGHKASFLAGGQFPVPVPQSGGGASNSITVEFKDFGVQLDFIPQIIDDELIRLAVVSEVSTIDDTLGTTLVPGGLPIPGLNTRRTSTTVEMNQGQTLAIAGLLQVTIEGDTARIPGLGDLPYIGPMFSNTSHDRVEKELLVMVTPYLVQPMAPEQVPPLPGSEIKDPNDAEFYFMNRIESRVGRDFRSTVRWDDRFRSHLIHHGHYQHGIGGENCQDCIIGPVGHSE